MNEKFLIGLFLSDIGVYKKDLLLLAEMIGSLERLITLDEQSLENLSWIDKKGDERKLLEPKHILNFLNELIAIDKISPAERLGYVRDTLIKGADEEKVGELLLKFHSAGNAAILRNKIKSISQLVSILGNEDQRTRDFDVERGFLNIFIKLLKFKPADWSSEDFLLAVGQDRKLFSKLLFLALFSNRLIKNSADFKLEQFTVRLPDLLGVVGWEVIAAEVQKALGESIEEELEEEKTLKIAERCYSIFESGLLNDEKAVLFCFASQISNVISTNVPKFLKEAMNSAHPFLIRPFFRSYPAALTFAIGGKLASSLETIWGTVGEELFVAMGGGRLRTVRNGGIDVVLGETAYDIKSGPAVMNKDQIQVLHAKQKIITEERRLPDIEEFRVALVYGKTENAFGTMAPDVRAGNIIMAREAWEILTGDPLAPERVYKLAAVIAEVVGVDSIIEAPSSDKVDVSNILIENSNAYDDDFQRLFDEGFDPPNSRPEVSLRRLEVLDALINRLRSIQC